LESNRERERKSHTFFFSSGISEKERGRQRREERERERGRSQREERGEINKQARQAAGPCAAIFLGNIQLAAEDTELNLRHSGHARAPSSVETLKGLRAPRRPTSPF
jgi:hypothetical protein